MELNSCLYETTIMHHRLSPKEHRFTYRFFSFYLDLDEIDRVARTIRLFNRNAFNVYAFYDRDHIEEDGNTVKENILSYLRKKGMTLDGGKIMLLTYVRTCGYVFNPVSFYFCYDAAGHPACVVPEIGNTFGEVKPFFIDRQKLSRQQFKDEQVKYYYVSPFMKLDDRMDFRLTIPGDTLRIGVDTSRHGRKVIVTSMMGHKRSLTNGNLLKLTLKFPLVTLKAIMLIHWHALLLWLKNVPYEEKTSNIHLQKEVYRAWNKDDRRIQGRPKPAHINALSKDH